MNATLDTSAVINLCNDDGETTKVVEYLKAHSDDAIYILAKTTDELKKLTQTQQANLDRIDAVCARDKQRYFTIGESTIGGSDVIRGDSAAGDGIQKEIVDISGAYMKYHKTQIRGGNHVKGMEDWLKQNNHQSDAVLYERATELGCDYFVSNDGRFNKVISVTKSCKPVTLEEFLVLLSS
jgi:hypothetical protein